MGQFRCIILITRKLFKCLVTRPFYVLTKIRMNECVRFFFALFLKFIHRFEFFFLRFFKVSRNKETNVNLKVVYWQNKIHEKLKKNRSAIQDKIVGNVLNLERLILFQKKLANANRFSETEQVNSWKSMSKTCLNSTNNKQQKNHYELEWSDTFEAIEPYTYRFIIKLLFCARKFVQKAA